MISFPRKYVSLNLKHLLQHKTLLEITVFLFTILLAGFLGNYVAHLATRQISNVVMKFIIGILIGLLIGIGVGILVKRTWVQIQLYFSNAQSQ